MSACRVAQVHVIPNSTCVRTLEGCTIRLQHSIPACRGQVQEPNVIMRCTASCCKNSFTITHTPLSCAKFSLTLITTGFAHPPCHLAESTPVAHHLSIWAALLHRRSSTCCCSACSGAPVEALGSNDADAPGPVLLVMLLESVALPSPAQVLADRCCEEGTKHPLHVGQNAGAVAQQWRRNQAALAAAAAAAG